MVDNSGKVVAQLGAAFNALGRFNPDQTSGPATVTIDAQGNFYVGDVGNHRIEKFNNQGKALLAWGSPGSGDGQFGVDFGGPNLPLNIAIDSRGNIYVSDPGNGRVQKFDPAGHFLLKWSSLGVGAGQLGSFASAGGQGGMAVDPFDNVWVIDQGSSRVEKFDSQGRFLDFFGSSGAGTGQFATPNGIAIDRQGNIFVTDEFRTQKFDKTGHFVSQFGNGARGIAIDQQGNVYLSGTKDQRIWKFDNNGNWLYEWGGAGSADGLFAPLGGLSGLAVDGQGNIFVADAANTRIQKFTQHLTA